ncbi:MAG: sorbosone dehydrogenase family protein [Bdellovibrionales bacterium]|nr:sorbosone dehydrogenase family protein [Bdellovibrionales bacterium]
MKTKLKPLAGKTLLILALLAGAMFYLRPGALSADELKRQIKLPPGFKIEYFARSLPGARSMARGDQGTVFVGTRSTNKLFAVKDTNGDHFADKVFVISDKLEGPNGVAFKDGSLYVAQTNRILRFDDIENRLSNPPQPVVVNDSYPTDSHHGWKYIGFGPDGYLYVPVGAPCNICKKDDERYASITRMKPDGSEVEVFAHGIRNSVGFDWHPDTKELWFTDNGRDWLGDDLPPCELNRAPKAGMNFGFPYCHGKGIKDPEFGDLHSCTEFTPPEQELGPHVAPLGMRFYTGEMFPKEYHGQIFIAEHGSWNRSERIGYRITKVTLQNGAAAAYEVFASGWLEENQKVRGRPVDLLILPDGSMLVSDDYAGALYRISYSAPQ